MTFEEIDAVVVNVEQEPARGRGREQQYLLEADNCLLRARLYKHRSGDWYVNFPTGGFVATPKSLTALIKMAAITKRIIDPEYIPDFEI